MGSDRERRHESASNSNFNPRSRTGSDGVSLKRCTNQANFNPRSPHGERQSLRGNPGDLFRISIHAPRMGSDRQLVRSHQVGQYFNPRSLMGSDYAPWTRSARHRNFNPRSLMGSDLRLVSQQHCCCAFQSTPPAWGATKEHTIISEIITISIHAPAWGATINQERHEVARIISIHAPAWGATVRLFVFSLNVCISIHAPAWGATPIVWKP